jgi:hypothetical protein
MGINHNQVFTYYTPLGYLNDEHDQRKLIELWAESWRRRGWTPVVLDESHARRHPRYKEFKKKFWELPTEYGHEYEGACFLRYVATAAMGGGMMTDYDVINYSFTPADADRAQAKYQSPQLILFADRPPDKVFCGAIHGCHELFEGLSQLFFEWVPSDIDFVTTSKTYRGYHCSDLSRIQNYFEGRRVKPDWFQLAPGCSLYTDKDWNTKPMTHYGYEMKRTGHWPKYEGIPRLRPI